MTRWLQAARAAGAVSRQPPPAKTAKTDKTPRGGILPNENKGVTPRGFGSRPFAKTLTKPPSAEVSSVLSKTAPTKPPTAKQSGSLAKHAAPEVSSVLSVLSGGAGAEIASSADDAATLAEYLRLHGPASYGAAATDLAWGASRAWRAEERLRLVGRITHDTLGRAMLMADTLDEWEERAAIREYDGGLSRADAEREAWRDILGAANGK